MRFGISAGAIVLDDYKRILLVHHYEQNEYDFWVPPGGRLERNESIYDFAKREVLEETGLHVELGAILNILEFCEPDYHFGKFFILGKIINGKLTLQNKDADENFLMDVRFFSQLEIQTLNVFPKILKDQFWVEYHSGNLATQYLGLEPIKF